jgi:hypothetical protein
MVLEFPNDGLDMVWAAWWLPFFLEQSVCCARKLWLLLARPPPPLRLGQAGIVWRLVVFVRSKPTNSDCEAARLPAVRASAQRGPQHALLPLVCIVRSCNIATRVLGVSIGHSRNCIFSDIAHRRLNPVYRRGKSRSECSPPTQHVHAELNLL